MPMVRMMLAAGMAVSIVVANAGVDRTSAGEPTVDVRPQPLEWIEPGTIIGRTAPAGWTDLILLATPRIAQGDLDKIAPTTSDYARMFHLAILADVRPGPPGGRDNFGLEKVGIGLTVDVDGREVVVSTEEARVANLGMIGRRVLHANEEIVRTEFRQVARTRTMVVFDARALILYQGNHAHLVIRHAVLCSPADGSVRTLVWLLGAAREGGYAPAEPALQWLTPALLEDRLLHVDGDKFILGVPSAEAFALVQIPQGTPIPLSPDLASATSTNRFTTETAPQLEDALRRACRETDRGVNRAGVAPAGR